MWSSSPINGPRCFLEQETLPLLLSTGWLHERIRSCFHNRTNIYWGRLWKIDLNVKYAPSLNIVKTKSKHREWLLFEHFLFDNITGASNSYFIKLTRFRPTARTQTFMCTSPETASCTLKVYLNVTTIWIVLKRGCCCCCYYFVVIIIIIFTIIIIIIILDFICFISCNISILIISLISLKMS